MKLQILAFTLLTTTNLLANSTMCFKENHPSLSTIEDTKLDGGECNSSKNLKEMKNDGWQVKDIKITPKNGNYSFIYIFTKKETILDEELEKKIIKKIEEKKLLQKTKSLEYQEQKDISLGKKIYISKCAQCHGEKGEIKAYDSSEALKTLSYEDMNFAIRKYTFDFDYGNGNEIIMQPYARSINSEDLKKVHKYLQTIDK